MPDHAREQAEKELGRLERMGEQTAESSVIRTYLDWLISVPWSKRSDEILDPQSAREQLDSDHAGIEITQVQLLRVEPPLAVIDAFNDVQRARADQERARNEAEAYANDILPRARGDAERIRQDAEAYKVQVVNLAEGESSAFLAVLNSYRAAKDVTSWRLYLEAVDEVLRKSTRVIVDASGKGVSAVLPYLPLNEIKPPPPAAAPTAPAPQGAAR